MEAVIDKQKQVALNVYEALSVIDPHCILAGGAPRDWYFNTPCNDLDFYFCSVATTVSSTRYQLQSMGFIGAIPSVNPCTSGLYKSMIGLVRIWDCKIDGVKVQLIQMMDDKSRWDVVENMDVSICKAWYTKSGEIELHNDFKLTLASGVMFLKDDGYCWSDKHGQKMKERFDGKFVCGTREQATNTIVRKVLKEIE